MSDKYMRKVRVKKRTDLGFNWFFWISLVIILIPCVYFVFLLISASKVTDTPILGDRIKNTISYTIDKSGTESISEEIKQLANVDDAEVNLIVETLRISVDGKNDMTEEEYTSLAKDVYKIVDKYFPINKYFTADGDYKQYDLEITVYDDLSKDDVTIISMVKNGVMEDYLIQTLSTPKNQALVNKLLSNEEIGTDVGEITGDDDASE